jgi:hypothetical protein
MPPKSPNFGGLFCYRSGIFISGNHLSSRLATKKERKDYEQYQGFSI